MNPWWQARPRTFGPCYSAVSLASCSGSENSSVSRDMTRTQAVSILTKAFPEPTSVHCPYSLPVPCPCLFPDVVEQIDTAGTPDHNVPGRHRVSFGFIKNARPTCLIDSRLPLICCSVRNLHLLHSQGVSIWGLNFAGKGHSMISSIFVAWRNCFWSINVFNLCLSLASAFRFLSTPIAWASLESRFLPNIYLHHLQDLQCLALFILSNCTQNLLKTGWIFPTLNLYHLSVFVYYFPATNKKSCMSWLNIKLGQYLARISETQLVNSHTKHHYNGSSYTLATEAITDWINREKFQKWMCPENLNRSYFHAVCYVSYLRKFSQWSNIDHCESVYNWLIPKMRQPAFRDGSSLGEKQLHTRRTGSGNWLK